MIWISIVAKIRERQGSTTLAIVEIGQLLSAAADSLPHGEFMPWIEREFDFSYRTAKRYRDVAEMASNLPVWQIWAGQLSKAALYAMLDQPNNVRAAVVETTKTMFVSAFEVARIAERLRVEAGTQPPIADEAAEKAGPAVDGPLDAQRTAASIIRSIFKLATSGVAPSNLVGAIEEGDLNFAIEFLREIKSAREEKRSSISSCGG
ncbi:DUF3102 domain-containing protein [Bradyrhizobium japonicum]